MGFCEETTRIKRDKKDILFMNSQGHVKERQNREMQDCHCQSDNDTDILNVATHNIFILISNTSP